MTGDLVLAVHVAAGAGGLAIGPIAIRDAARGAPGGRAGDAYHWLVALVCLSAVALAVGDPSRLWFFAPIAAASYGFALRAYLAARRRHRNWRQAQVRGYGGAYIALVTALIVVSFAGLPALWVAPTAIGAPALHWLDHRTRRATPRRTAQQQP